VDYFLHRFRGELGRNVRGIRRDALQRLIDYDWPGNVRELENLLKRAMVLARSDTLTQKDVVLTGPQPCPRGGEDRGGEDLEEKLRGHLTAMFRLLRQAPGEVHVLEVLERDLILEALRETQGNQSQAARLLGMNRNTLRNKMRAYSIRGDERPGEGERGTPS